MASGTLNKGGTAFVAGASGAVGTVLCQLLTADGWRVVGATRTPERADRLRALNVEPVLVDVFDRARLVDAVAAARPEVVVHQLTDLPKRFSPEGLAAARPGTARLRVEGTANLLAAAAAAGARRIVAQSIAFAYAPGPQPQGEDAPLDGKEYSAVATHERLILKSGLDAVVLRYGRFYGPNTWTDVPNGPAPVHVEAAADAARRAMIRGSGIYNVAEEDGAVTSAKARHELGWTPDFRCERP